MSILIKGMEMPEDGHWGTVSIPFYIHGDGSVSDSKGHIIGSAVPVPDHGRLGDLDALMEQFDGDCYGCPYDTCMARELIDAAPTVIPASGGGDAK